MLRITSDPSYALRKLVELGWEETHVQVVYDRLIALAQRGEDFVEVGRRLNPAKSATLPYEPPVAHIRAVRESPALGLELSARVRDARNRLNA